MYIREATGQLADLWPRTPRSSAISARRSSNSERGGRSPKRSFANRAGLHPTYISDMERGARNPSFEVLVRLMRGLDMPVAELGAAYDRTSRAR